MCARVSINLYSEIILVFVCVSAGVYWCQHLHGDIMVGVFVSVHEVKFTHEAKPVADLCGCVVHPRHCNVLCLHVPVKKKTTLVSLHTKFTPTCVYVYMSE